MCGGSDRSCSAITVVAYLRGVFDSAPVRSDLTHLRHVGGHLEKFYPNSMPLLRPRDHHVWVERAVSSIRELLQISSSIFLHVVRIISVLIACNRNRSGRRAHIPAMGLDALGVLPDFVPEDDATPSGSPTNTTETYTSEPQYLPTPDTDGCSDASLGTSTMGIRSFYSDSFNYQHWQFAPELGFLPSTTYNSITWPSQEPKSFYEPYHGMSEGTTTDLQKLDNYSYP